MKKDCVIAMNVLSQRSWRCDEAICKIHPGDTENMENFSVRFTQILCELCVSVVFQ